MAKVNPSLEVRRMPSAAWVKSHNAHQTRYARFQTRYARFKTSSVCLTCLNQSDPPSDGLQRGSRLAKRAQRVSPFRCLTQPLEWLVYYDGL